jgi:hypothetical protein
MRNIKKIKETKCFMKFYDELLKSEDRFCLCVEIKKTTVNYHNTLIPCIEIEHVQGGLKFTPDLLDSENSVCLYDIWTFDDCNNIIYALLSDTNEVLEKINITWGTRGDCIWNSWNMKTQNFAVENQNRNILIMNIIPYCLN